MNGYTKCGISIQLNIIQPSKGGNSDTCYHMDETWGHDAENKPVTKGQILDSTHMIYLEEINS